MILFTEPLNIARVRISTHGDSMWWWRGAKTDISSDTVLRLGEPRFTIYKWL